MIKFKDYVFIKERNSFDQKDKLLYVKVNHGLIKKTYKISLKIVKVCY